jgi:predicted ATPase/DNA-binding SARP family transcriptional activator
VKVGILGHLTIDAEDGGSTVGAPLQRALLCLLALHAPRPVPVEQILGGLWGEDPPSSARKVLQGYISALRRALPTGVIETVPAGYALRVGRDDVDAQAFEDSVSDGRTLREEGQLSEAANRLSSGLALWRGRPIPELSDHLIGLNAATRLEELRRTAEEDLFGLRLDLGEHIELVSELEYAVAAEPLRERRWGQLMLALYRSGRQAEALRAFRRLTSTLDTELGIAPSAELSHLEESILLQKPELDWAPTAGAQRAPTRTSGGQSGRRHNLPAPVSSFIGRARDVEHVAELLHTTRLLTLTGPGGAGKTRLALQVASRREEERQNGVWFADLAPIDDGGLAAQVIADALGFRPRSDRPVLEHLCEYLKDRDLLLVVDNCEHLIDSVDLIDSVAYTVEQLLTSAPGLTVLATSREPLLINGETQLEVRPLEVPLDLDRGHAAAIWSAEAVQLFVERAHARRPDLDLGEEAPVIGEIVVRLDGLPLAIELAAARIGMLPASEILRGLEDRFEVLRNGPRTVLRHTSLEATLEWSYRLLAAEEKALFARSSVFAGSFSLDALHAIAAGAPLGSRRQIVDGVEGLVSKSLLTRTDDQGPPRFRLLETVRVYAEDRLAEGEGDLDPRSVRLAHARYYADLAGAAGRDLVGPEQAHTLASLKKEHDNLRVALRHLLADPERLDMARELFGALGRYWFVTAQPSESIAFAETLLGPAQLVGSTEPRIRALRAGAWASVLERPPLAWDWCNETLRVSLETGDDALAAEVTSMLAAISLFMGTPDLLMADRAVTLAKEVADPVITGMAYLGSGLAVSVSDPQGARNLFEEGLVATARSGDLLIEYLLLGAVGSLCYAAGEKGLARKGYEAALALAEQLGFPNPLYRANMGLILLDEGDVLGAIDHLIECLRSARQSTVQQSLGPVYDLAHCAVVCGEHVVAARMYGFADTRAGEKGLKNVEMDNLRPGDVTALHLALGEVGYCSELDVGARLGMDDVIELADEFAERAGSGNPLSSPLE